jgi:hypothetical protein
MRKAPRTTATARMAYQLPEEKYWALRQTRDHLLLLARLTELCTTADGWARVRLRTQADIPRRGVAHGWRELLEMGHVFRLSARPLPWPRSAGLRDIHAAARPTPGRLGTGKH